MAKGMITVGMPEDCYGCDIVTTCGECCVTGDIVDHLPGGRRPAWCPIKPVPGKIQGGQDDMRKTGLEGTEWQRE